MDVMAALVICAVVDSSVVSCAPCLFQTLNELIALARKVKQSAADYDAQMEQATAAAGMSAGASASAGAAPVAT